MLYTKRLIIVLGLLIVSGCLTQSSDAFKDLKYDWDIASTSLDGFRIQMSPRMAKKIASEKGYEIDTQFSDVTFDDIIEAGLKEHNSIYLSRSGEGKSVLNKIELVLSFEYGKTYHINLKHVFADHEDYQQRAEDLLEFYLKKYPQLVLSKEDENFRAYTYKPNSLAYLSVTVDTRGPSRVSITVRDMNYSLNKEILEIYQMDL